MNELTFVARLAAYTHHWSEERKSQGRPALIARGDIEEREVDSIARTVVRCDMRLNDERGRKLVSGEFKRPEHPDGRDPRAERLRADARRKATARGLPLYFTCNMRQIVLFSLPSRPGEAECEIAAFPLADIERAAEADAADREIQRNWCQFLESLEKALAPLVHKRPVVTRAGVVELKTAIEAVVNEGLARAARYLTTDQHRLDRAKLVATQSFGFAGTLNPKRPTQFRKELAQLLRLSAFVAVQKLILYRVLSETGPKRLENPFALDPLQLPSASTEPPVIRRLLEDAVAHAIQRSGDYATAFLPTPEEDLLFVSCAPDEVAHCRVGAVWHDILRVIQQVSWSDVSQSVVGYLYEAIIDPFVRHLFGQYYTNEDVVDVLVTFAVRSKWDIVLDPASGGGSFVRSVYRRKRDLGAAHEEALSEIWATEISAFAAQLTAIALATGSTFEPAADPRVWLTDFLSVFPRSPEPRHSQKEGHGRFPVAVDAVVGNPPYISYRRQTNQKAIARTLVHLRRAGFPLPLFSGKSDAYVWFLVHATEFLKTGGRLGFVVSSAILFADYGIPLIRFLARYYRIRAVVDSLVEQWFEDADTNTVLLLLEREDDPLAREQNFIRFVRLRVPLSRLLPSPGDGLRRQAAEDLIEAICNADPAVEDPRFQVNGCSQGRAGGIELRMGDATWLDEAEADGENET